MSKVILKNKFSLVDILYHLMFAQQLFLIGSDAMKYFASEGRPFHSNFLSHINCCFQTVCYWILIANLTKPSNQLYRQVMLYQAMNAIGNDYIEVPHCEEDDQGSRETCKNNFVSLV